MRTLPTELALECMDDDLRESITHDPQRRFLKQTAMIDMFKKEFDQLDLSALFCLLQPKAGSNKRCFEKKAYEVRDTLRRATLHLHDIVEELEKRAAVWDARFITFCGCKFCLHEKTETEMEMDESG